MIITGGKLDLSFAGSFFGTGKPLIKIIAVDAGLEAVKALGLEPDMIVGDFDTVKPEVLAYYRRMEHIVWDTHQPEKDETDTELALLKAQATGCTEVVVLGATGGRMDHMLGNIHLLFPCLQKGMEAYILDSQNRIYLIDKERTFNRREIWGKYISFLPLTEEVRGITLTGFKYPLHEKDIEIGTSLCISNELVGEKVRRLFRFLQDILIVGLLVYLVPPALEFYRFYFTRYSTVFKVPLGFVYLGFFVFQIITIVRYCGDLAGCYKEFRKGGKAV